MGFANNTPSVWKAVCSCCLLSVFNSIALDINYRQKESTYLVLLQCTFLLHVWTILPCDNGFDVCNWN